MKVERIGIDLAKDVYQTYWQIVMEKLALDLDTLPIPVVVGPWSDGQDPSMALVDTSNFEVIASPPKP